MRMKWSFKIPVALMTVLLLFTWTAGGEERNIFVGDLIVIEITAADYTYAELENIFREFEIVHYRELERGYELTLRTFEPGEYNIRLGDKELQIVVSSILEEMDNGGIFHGDAEPLDSYYSKIYIYVILVFLPIFILLTAYSSWLFIKGRRRGKKTPFQVFHRKLEAIETGTADFFVELTFIFKEYLEKSFDCLIRGKPLRRSLLKSGYWSRLKKKSLKSGSGWKELIIISLPVLRLLLKKWKK